MENKEVNTQTLSFDPNSLKEDLRTEICELLIQAAKEFKEHKVYCIGRGFVEKKDLKSNAEWYLYIDTISNNEISFLEKEISDKWEALKKQNPNAEEKNRKEYSKLIEETKTEVIKKIDNRNIIKAFTEFYQSNIKVFLYNSFSTSQMLYMEDERISKFSLQRIIFLIHPDNINEFLVWTEDLAKSMGEKKDSGAQSGHLGIAALSNDSYSPAFLKPVILDQKNNHNIAAIPTGLNVTPQ